MHTITMEAICDHHDCYNVVSVEVPINMFLQRATCNNHGGIVAMKSKTAASKASEYYEQRVKLGATNLS